MLTNHILFYSKMMILCFLLASCAVEVGTIALSVNERARQALGDDSKIRANAGAIFTQRMRSLHIVNSFEHVIFMVRLPEFTIPSEVKPALLCPPAYFAMATHNFRQYYREFRQRCSGTEHKINQGIAKFNAMLLILNDTIRSLNATYEAHLLPRDSTRTKRGFFNTVGKFFSDLFGTVHKSQYAKLVKYVQDLHNTNAMDHRSLGVVQDMVTAAINSTDMRFGKMWAALRATHSQLDERIKNITDQYDRDGMMRENYNNYYHEILRNLVDGSITIRELLSDVHNLHHSAQDWIAALEALGRGSITPTIIPPTHLSSAIGKLESKLKAKAVGIGVVYNSRQLSFYYSRRNAAKFWYDRGSIYISLKVPLGNPTLQLEVYEVSSFPIPFHPHEKNVSQGYTWLNIRKPFLVIQGPCCVWAGTMVLP